MVLDRHAAAAGALPLAARQRCGAGVIGSDADRHFAHAVGDGERMQHSALRPAIQRDIGGKARMGRRYRLEGDDLPATRVLRGDKRIEPLIGADIDKHEIAVLAQQQVGKIAAIGTEDAIAEGGILPVGHHQHTIA
jgi:hypothetical protein